MSRRASSRGRSYNCFHADLNARSLAPKRSGIAKLSARMADKESGHVSLLRRISFVPNTITVRAREGPYFASLALIPELSTSFATRGRSVANRRACASGVISLSGNGKVPSCFSFSSRPGSDRALARASVRINRLMLLSISDLASRYRLAAALID
jgi:hypothetical protein